MPKIITTIEYSLFDAIQIIHKTNYHVNGGTPQRLNTHDITKIEFADKSRKVVYVNHKKSRYQINLESTVCLLMAGF